MGLYNCIMGLFNCIMGLYNCIMGLYNCIMGLHYCIMGLFKSRARAHEHTHTCTHAHAHNVIPVGGNEYKMQVFVLSAASESLFSSIRVFSRLLAGRPDRAVQRLVYIYVCSIFTCCRYAHTHTYSPARVRVPDWYRAAYLCMFVYVFMFTCCRCARTCTYHVCGRERGSLTHAAAYTHTRTYTRTHARTRARAHTHAHMHTRTHARTHAHTQTHRHTDTHTHTCTRAHAHARTHALTHKCVRQGAGKPDSYRAVQRLVKPLAEAGRERLKARVRRSGEARGRESERVGYEASESRGTVGVGCV
jgi:hypothetical protein